MRRFWAFLGIWLALAQPAAAVPGAWTVIGNFVPVQHILTSSGTETVPVGPTQAILELWAPGGAGGAGTIGLQNGGGGSSGSYGTKTLTLTPSDWGKTFTCTLGSPGTGATLSDGTAGTGPNTLVNGTDAQTVNISANFGLGGQYSSNGGAGGAAPSAGTGGTTNTAGNAGQPRGGSPGAGGAAVVGGATGLSAGGGGSGASVGAGNSGSGGQCAFTYSWLYGWDLHA